MLIAGFAGWHESHEAADAALSDDVDLIPAHALVETYSVLTRLPAPLRAPADVVSGYLAAVDAEIVVLSAAEMRALIATFGARGVTGGQTYDAVIAATARRHGATLLTLDRRARTTYEALDCPTRYLVN